MTESHDSAPAVANPPDVGGAKHAHAHPSDWEYIKIALVLGMITLAEVAIYYVESLGTLLNYILIALSLVKFTMVVMWFMHLRFDSKLFRRLFVTGIILALFVYTIVLTTFHIFTRQ